MQLDGYGGRGGNHSNENLDVLKGLLFNDWPDEVFLIDGTSLPEQSCANPRCGRIFQPRAEGDDYCNEKCDPLNKFRGIEVTRDD